MLAAHAFNPGQHGPTGNSPPLERVGGAPDKFQPAHGYSRPPYAVPYAAPYIEKRQKTVEKPASR